MAALAARQMVPGKLLTKYYYPRAGGDLSQTHTRSSTALKLGNFLHLNRLG